MRAAAGAGATAHSCRGGDGDPGSGGWVQADGIGEQEPHGEGRGGEAALGRR